MDKTDLIFQLRLEKQRILEQLFEMSGMFLNLDVPEETMIQYDMLTNRLNAIDRQLCIFPETKG